MRGNSTYFALYSLHDLRLGGYSFTEGRAYGESGYRGAGGVSRCNSHTWLSKESLP